MSTISLHSNCKVSVPHIIIEHSRLPLDMDALNAAVHAAASGMEALPVGGLRVRNHPVEVARTGDGRQGAGFIYIRVRLGRGRSEAVRRDIGESLMDLLRDFTAEHFARHPLSLGVEVEEIAGLTFKHNNIHDILRAGT